MITIVHIITGLNNGGAEMMLYKLLKYSDRTKYRHEVISMMDYGTMGKKIEALDIKVNVLNMKRGVPNPKSFISALRMTRRCDIMQTWMYHADLFGFILAVINRKKLVWGIRHSNLVKGVDKKSTILLAKINAVLSYKPDKIILNSENALEYYQQLGYKTQRMMVIPNGFEMDDFYKRKNNLKQMLHIKDNQIVLLSASRWHPMKGKDILLEAVSYLMKEGYDFKLVLCGTGMDNENIKLMTLIEEFNLTSHVILLGRREDMPELMSVADIFVSSSISGEGFPNVIGEAMACETPCVVTDVGDSKNIVSDFGLVVKPSAPIELFDAMIQLIHMNTKERENLRIGSRKRILKYFDIKEIAKKFENVYSELMNASYENNH